MAKIELDAEQIIRFAHAGLKLGNVDAAFRLLDECVQELDRRKAEATKPEAPPSPAAGAP